MKADRVPPSALHARTTCAATSRVHLDCRAATNHAGSAFVVAAVLVVIMPRTVRHAALGHYLGRTGGLVRPAQRHCVRREAEILRERLGVAFPEN